MSTNRVIFIIGLLVLAVPFSGFPRSWEEGFLMIAGFALVFLSSINIWQRSLLKRLKFHSEQQVENPQQNTETPDQEHHYEETIPQYTSQGQ